jgi:hypothetical protein
VTTQLRLDFDLPTLQIALDRVGAHDDQMVFRLGQGARELVEVARCGIDDVGLPSLLSEDRAIGGATSVLPGILERLREFTGGMNLLTPLGERVLWLEFPHPRGLLHTLPWERLLEPLEHRIVRLPTHIVSPLQSRRTNEVGICVGALDDERVVATDTLFHLLTSYVRRIRLPGFSGTLHVFTDDESAESARTAVHRVQDWVIENPWARWAPAGFEPAETPAIVIHNPDRPLPSKKVASASPVGNPWLVWMCDEIAEKPLDEVHFVCRGDFYNQHGAMRLTTGLANSDDQRAIDVGELNAFMTQVGAYSLALTGLKDDRSLAALRELVDAVTFERPGYFTVHDLQRDPACEQLSSFADPAPAITCWSYPTFDSGNYSNQLLGPDRTSIFFPESARRVIQEGTAERWLVATARVMESLHMQWLPSQYHEVADGAAVDALRNVAAIIDRYASEYAHYGSSKKV